MISNATCPACAYTFALGVHKKQPLNRPELNLFSYIRAYDLAHGFIPSYRQMKDMMNYSAISSIHRLLKGMEKKGWLSRTYAKNGHPHGKVLILP